VIAELRESRRRLVLTADADRRRIEREFHDGVQQHLIALAVKLQLASADAAEMTSLLDEMRSDVRQALDEAARLAQRIYPTLLAPGGLAAALRAVASGSGGRVSVEVDAGGRYPPEVACTVYFLCLEALERGATSIAVRDHDDALAFDLVTDAADELDALRDRVEALGGHMTIVGDTRVCGALPLVQ
jgi:signal transduction histidine kinase